MVHFQFGNYSRPVGRQSFGYNQVNINSYEKNVYGGFPMAGGMYGMNAGMFPTQYGMPGMGGFGMDCCGHGHNNNWGVGDTLMALGSLATGFFGAFNGGGATVEAKDSKTDVRQTEAFQEAIKQMQEEHKKANEARNQEIAALKAQVEELKKQQETTEVKPETEVEDVEETTETEETTEVEETEETSEVEETPATTEADATEAARKKEEARKAEQARKEAEALKKEGITKNDDGSYSAEFTTLTGKKTTVTAKSADEVRKMREENLARIEQDKQYCQENGIEIKDGKFVKTSTTITGKSETLEASTLSGIKNKISEFNKKNTIENTEDLTATLNEHLKEDKNIEGKVKGARITSDKNGKKTIIIGFEGNGLFKRTGTIIIVNDMTKDYNQILSQVKDHIDDSFA